MSLLTCWLSFGQVGLAQLVRTHWVTTTNFMGFHPIPRSRAYLGASMPGFGPYAAAQYSQIASVPTPEAVPAQARSRLVRQKCIWPCRQIAGSVGLVPCRNIFGVGGRPDSSQTSTNGAHDPYATCGGIRVSGFMDSGVEPCGTPHALYSNPFAFRTVWAAGEERNVTSALAASV
jgi:hypothetical protein